MSFPETVLCKGGPGCLEGVQSCGYSGQQLLSPSYTLPAHQLYHETGKALEQKLLR